MPTYIAINEKLMTELFTEWQPITDPSRKYRELSDEQRRSFFQPKTDTTNR